VLFGSAGENSQGIDNLFQADSLISIDVALKGNTGIVIGRGDQTVFTAVFRVCNVTAYLTV